MQAWLPNGTGTTTISIHDQSGDDTALSSYTLSNTDEFNVVYIDIDKPAQNGIMDILINTTVDVKIKKIIIY